MRTTTIKFFGGEILLADISFEVRLMRLSFIGTLTAFILFAGCRSPGVDMKPPLVLEPNRYSYTFAVPKGWDFSFTEAHREGVKLVFFPKGGGFHKSKSIVYVNEIRKEGCSLSLREAVDDLEARYRALSPSLQSTIASPIQTQEGRIAEVMVYTGARDPRQAKEAVAFLEEEDKVVIVVLTTMSTDSWDVDFGAFQEIVIGYRHFTCDSPGLAVPCS